MTNQMVATLQLMATLMLMSTLMIQLSSQGSEELLQKQQNLMGKSKSKFEAHRIE
jgi:hypothetical protein